RGIASALLFVSASLGLAAEDHATLFRTKIQPILKEYCYDCHADGANKGQVAFDEFRSDETMLGEHELWLKALKNLRASIMPPPKRAQPSAEQKRQLEEWIKTAVFKADAQNPDPGRVTVRRLNRVEYRNTVRDLLGVDFDTDKEFPPDDSGHGFDNIGDVLTLPPMLLEKYLAAAKSVVTKAVPTVPGVPAEKVIGGREFSGEIGPLSSTNRSAMATNALVLSYYERASISNSVKIQHAGRYQLLLDFTANERFVDNQFDYNKCRLVFKADGKELHSKEYPREGTKAFHYEFDRDWKPGEHQLLVELHPLTPTNRQVRSLTLRLDSVMVRGPLDQKYWIRPKDFEKFFAKDAPTSASGRREYARKILGPFIEKAYRRPVDTETLDRLVNVVETTYSQKGKTFEAGIAQAMVAVMASPRFLFREESAEAATTTAHPLVDEYALASRLSYFLWSSMPDAELMSLASQKKLRANLSAQMKRMLADSKSEAFVRNFVGQWLQTRDIETVTIDGRQVLNREIAEAPVVAAAPVVDANREKRMTRFRELRMKEETNDVAMTAAERKELQEVHDGLFGPQRVQATQTNQVAQRGQSAQTNQFGRGFRGFRGQSRSPRAELTGELRRAMRQETEKAFDYILREDRSLLEMGDAESLSPRPHLSPPA
ncbi:MAG TPA: DUF1592 domain-containing protein, partial [Candidatus Acidoferrum sp.]|nr:DUF1592 domain-containing protein [Candidatus Acidoferrum sp.]